MNSINTTIFYFLYNLAHQSAILDKLVVFFAVYFPYMVVLLAILFLFSHYEKKLKWAKLLYILFSIGLAWFIAGMLKVFIHVQRPFIQFSNVHPLIPESGFSFPSGHATFFSALAVAIFLYHKKAGYWFMGFAFLIGLARIIAGVHFPLDILGGFAVGTIVAYFLRFI
jgi:undecaprenyl-diphosphatase